MTSPLHLQLTHTLSVAILAGVFVLAPVAPDASFAEFGANTVFAKGGGGNGGGHGNAGANGHGGGHASATSDANDDNGNHSGHGNGNGGAAVGHSHDENGGIAKGGHNASLRGSLNAAHASSTARANASSNSQVAKVKAYMDAVDQEAIDVEEAGVALANAANKSVDLDVVNAVNSLLGIDMDEDTAQSIAAAAATEQSDAPEEESDESDS